MYTFVSRLHLSVLYPHPRFDSADVDVVFEAFAARVKRACA